MNKILTCLPCAGLVLAALSLISPASHAAAAPPGTVHLDLLSEGVAVEATADLVLAVRSTFWPPSRIQDVVLVGEEIHVTVLNPETWKEVPEYQYALPIKVPPLGRSINAAIRVFALDSPQDPVTLEIASTLPERLWTFEGWKILEVRPLAPTPDDDIVVRVNFVPSRPPEIVRGQGVVRIVEKDLVAPAPGGREVHLGKLPAGTWRLELELAINGNHFPNEGIQDELILAVRPTGAAEQPVAVLAGNFEVGVTWRNAAGESGEGRLVQAPSQDSALFYFFSPDNWELMVKVLDGCAINGHYWVFGAASTDVAYEIEITRRGSNQTFAVNNPLGNAAAAITEIEAFPCDPAAPQG